MKAPQGRTNSRVSHAPRKMGCSLVLGARMACICAAWIKCDPAPREATLPQVESGLGKIRMWGGGPVGKRAHGYRECSPMKAFVTANLARDPSWSAGAPQMRWRRLYEHYKPFPIRVGMGLTARTRKSAGGNGKQGTGGGANGSFLCSDFSVSAFQRFSFFPIAPRLGPTSKSQRTHLGEQRPVDILTPPSRVWRASVGDLRSDPVLARRKHDILTNRPLFGPPRLTLGSLCPRGPFASPSLLWLPFTAELAPAGVSPNRSLLSLLSPTIPCRGRTCTCKHVKDRRLHIGICFWGARLYSALRG